MPTLRSSSCRQHTRRKHILSGGADGAPPNHERYSGDLVKKKGKQKEELSLNLGARPTHPHLGLAQHSPQGVPEILLAELVVEPVEQVAGLEHQMRVLKVRGNLLWGHSLHDRPGEADVLAAILLTRKKGAQGKLKKNQ